MTATVIELFESTARRHADTPAMRFKTDGRWHDVTWREYRERVLVAARAFAALGVEPGRGVAILGFNRPEWFESNLGAIAASGVPTGIYTTSTAEQCVYVTRHCEAAVLVVENDEYLGRMRPFLGELPDLKAVVCMEGASSGDRIHSWKDLVGLAERVAEAEIRRRIDRQRPDDLCSLIYTSGTTGAPKGVMLSHRNIVWITSAVLDLLRLEPGELMLSYLPLSHIAEQLLSLYAPIRVGACSAFAESLEAMPRNLAEIRPHAFFGVPRVWEKIQAGIEAAGAGSGALKKRLVCWARRQGIEGGYRDQRGQPRQLAFGLAQRLVFSKVRRKLGLDRARICATSAAPISRSTLEFFLSLGIPIYEVYGMSECCGPTTISTPERYRTGKAGFAIPGTELEIAGDGEIRMRGPHVFLGYYKDEAATRDALDAESWLNSGDIGEIDVDGFLSVTDRKKELLITSGGKNVAPQPIEAELKTIPGVALAAVVGDRRNYLSALLTLDPERLPVEAERLGSPARSPTEASSCGIFRAYLERRIERLNRGFASFETVKRFRVLPDQFSIAGGELTPTMKLRRRVVYEKYASEIEALYAAPLGPAPESPPLSA